MIAEAIEIFDNRILTGILHRRIGFAGSRGDAGAGREPVAEAQVVSAKVAFTSPKPAAFRKGCWGWRAAQSRRNPAAGLCDV